MTAVAEQSMILDGLMERWLPVVEYEGLYKISDMGRVWSEISEQFISPTLCGSSGKRYRVKLYRNGIRRYCYVHVLMLEAFVGPRPIGMHGCHGDDTHVNRLSNLRWDTPGSNQKDQVRNGNHANARKTHCKPYGHALTDDNIYITKAGGRRCRACKRLDDQRRRAAA